MHLSTVLRLCFMLLVATLAPVPLPHARAQAPLLVRMVEITGIKRTRESTVLELLPRAPPNRYSQGELDEFARRLSNLAIFDSVEVTLEQDVVRVALREKWTLMPGFDFGSGKTLKDSYVGLGLFEYNAFGTGTTMSAWAAWVDRGPNFALDFGQHPYRPGRWAKGATFNLETSGFRFPDENGWLRRRTGGGIAAISPFLYALPLSYEIGISYYYETSLRVERDFAPPDGHELALTMLFTWNRYHWHDYAPRGYSLSLRLSPGVFLGPTPEQLRSMASSEFMGALRITNTMVLMARVKASVLTRSDNVNYSFLLGSVSGVRGLDDAFYRNWALSATNVELRQALPIAKRWALQGVLFTDAAVFASMDAYGQPERARQALSSGFGVRVIPTALYDGVLRFDVARLLVPEQLWFYQFGVTQYF